MVNEIKIVTTNDGTDIPVLVIIPNLLPKGSLSSNRKRGYTKPTPWPSK